MKRVLILIVLLMLCAATATAAEDVFTVDVHSLPEDAWSEKCIAANLTSDRSYLRVTCPVEGEMQVTLSISDASGSLVYQRDYGLCSGTFRSEDVYLRLTGSQTVYQVTLWTGDNGYSFPLRRVMPRLIANAACSVGYPLERMTDSGGWKTATLLDVQALEGRELTVALHASNAYEIGVATFSVEDGILTVSAQLDENVDGSIDKAAVQVATTALEAEKLGRKNFHGTVAGLDQPVDLMGTPYAAVYVNLTVSFDPSGLPGSPETEVEDQEETWQRMQTETANEAIG